MEEQKKMELNAEKKARLREVGGCKLDRKSRVQLKTVISDLTQEGKTAIEIAQHLNSSGFKTPTGRPFTGMIVANYKGTTRYKETRCSRKSSENPKKSPDLQKTGVRKSGIFPDAITALLDSPGISDQTKLKFLRFWVEDVR